MIIDNTENFMIEKNILNGDDEERNTYDIEVR